MMGIKVKTCLQRGSILILALWIMSLLSIFAVHIGLKVRQRVSLLSRIEKRSEKHFIAAAGIKKGISALLLDLKRNAGIYTAYGKFYRHNNNEKFENISLGKGAFDVFYDAYDHLSLESVERFGMVDEESKININTSDRSVLEQLIRIVVTSNKKDVTDLVDAIIGWREYGQADLSGFYSDDYYSNLKYAYEPKNEEFEVMDELLLVKGFSPEVYQRLMPFITIYGNGQVNINTASKIVLMSLGLSEEVVDKILAVRRGLDGMEHTVDDYVFLKTFDIASDIAKFTEIKIDEVKQIDALNQLNWITTNSQFYLFKSRGKLNEKDNALNVFCVYNVKENRIEHWKEKY